MGCKGERCPWTMVVALGGIRSSVSTSIEAILSFSRNELLFSSFVRGAERKVTELTSVAVVMVYKKNQRFAPMCSFRTMFMFEKRKKERASSLVIGVFFASVCFVMTMIIIKTKEKERRRETACICARNNHSNGNKKNNVTTQTVKEEEEKERERASWYHHQHGKTTQPHTHMKKSPDEPTWTFRFGATNA